MSGQCNHESRTPQGCDLCRLIGLVRERGAVGNGVDDTFTSCPYCAALVRCHGVPPTIYHLTPECDRYLADVGGGTLQAYVDKLHAKIRGAGRE